MGQIQGCPGMVVSLSYFLGSKAPHVGWSDPLRPSMSLYGLSLVAISIGLISEDDNNLDRGSGSAAALPKLNDGLVGGFDSVSPRGSRRRTLFVCMWVESDPILSRSFSPFRSFLYRLGFTMGGSFGSRGLLDTTNGQDLPKGSFCVYVPTIDKVPSILSFSKVLMCANCELSVKARRGHDVFPSYPGVPAQSRGRLVALSARANSAYPLVAYSLEFCTLLVAIWKYSWSGFDIGTTV